MNLLGQVTHPIFSLALPAVVSLIVKEKARQRESFDGLLSFLGQIF